MCTPPGRDVMKHISMLMVNGVHAARMHAALREPQGDRSQGSAALVYTANPCTHGIAGLPHRLPCDIAYTYHMLRVHSMCNTCLGGRTSGA